MFLKHTIQDIEKQGILYSNFTEQFSLEIPETLHRVLKLTYIRISINTKLHNPV